MHTGDQKMDHSINIVGSTSKFQLRGDFQKNSNTLDSMQTCPEQPVHNSRVCASLKLLIIQKTGGFIFFFINLPLSTVEHQ